MLRAPGCPNISEQHTAIPKKIKNGQPFLKANTNSPNSLLSQLQFRGQGGSFREFVEQGGNLGMTLISSVPLSGWSGGEHVMKFCPIILGIEKWSEEKGPEIQIRGD